MTTLRVAGAQINPIVGDIASNAALVLDAMAWAEDAGADVLLLPELVLCGYPPEDLVLREDFVARGLTALNEIVAVSGEVTSIIGFVDRARRHRYRARLHHPGVETGRFPELEYAEGDRHQYAGGDTCDVRPFAAHDIRLPWSRQGRHVENPGDESLGPLIPAVVSNHRRHLSHPPCDCTRVLPVKGDR